MAAFKKFEEIQAWQKARIATKRVYEVTSDTEVAKMSMSLMKHLRN
jgi:Mn-containing catalase